MVAGNYISVNKRLSTTDTILSVVELDNNLTRNFKREIKQETSSSLRTKESLDYSIKATIQR